MGIFDILCLWWGPIPLTILTKQVLKPQVLSKLMILLADSTGRLLVSETQVCFIYLYYKLNTHQSHLEMLWNGFPLQHFLESRVHNSATGQWIRRKLYHNKKSTTRWKHLFISGNPFFSEYSCILTKCPIKACFLLFHTTISKTLWCCMICFPSNWERNRDF